MDPDEALAQIRAILDKPGEHSYADLAELVDGLDSWLTSGGFLPAAWAARPPDTPSPLSGREA